MMKQIKCFLFVVFALAVVGCASYQKRKECEQTNWYAYGEKLALAGGSIEGDNFINECKKVEGDIGHAALDQGFKAGRAEYCKPETVFQMGKNGERFKVERCDENPRALTAKYQEGVRWYCRPSNGIAAGGTGKKYLGVCPKEMEDDFIPEFNKGRKKYLDSQIAASTEEIRAIDQDIQRLEIRKQDMKFRLARLPVDQIYVREKIRDKNGKVIGETQRLKESEQSIYAREQLRRDIDNVDWEIRNKRKEQETIRVKLNELKTEIATL